MATIRILPDILASQVAAGEVVERPSSVVKELVENSIDANAREILVEIERGGTALIRVTDDGSGMEREDALLSLERHATSKLRLSSDLNAIATLGFRGEAVPSIASVSRFRLITRERSEIAGTEIVVDGGKVKDVRDAGIDVPVRIGVAGPASITTLVKFAMRCGVGNSLRALTKRPQSFGKLLTDNTPDELIADLAQAFEGIEGPLPQLHLFPFGGAVKAGKWLAQLKS